MVGDIYDQGEIPGQNMFDNMLTNTKTVKFKNKTQL